MTLTKPENVNKILSELNSFHENLRFTAVDNFDNSNVHFLDQRLNKMTIDVYRNDTNTSQYVALLIVMNHGSGFFVSGRFFVSFFLLLIFCFF